MKLVLCCFSLTSFLFVRSVTSAKSQQRINALVKGAYGTKRQSVVNVPKTSGGNFVNLVGKGNFYGQSQPKCMGNVAIQFIF